MSSQTQQQQQPAVVYPYSVSLQAPRPPSHHRNGSFATVFIVVGVIMVASAISCFLGRFCNRRMNQTKPSSKRKQNRNLRPKEGGSDIEFGPDGRVPSGKFSGGDHPGETSKGFDLKMPGNHGDPRVFRVSEHGEPAAEFRMPGNGYHGDPREFRVSEHGEPEAEYRMPGNGYHGDPREFRVSEHGEPEAEYRMPGNGYPGEFRVSEHGEPVAEFRMPGNGYPRMPENGDYVRFRMPDIGDPIGFRMTGHGGDINGETKPVVDVGGSRKAGT